MEKHKNIYVALAAAQPDMDPPLKGSENPHFKAKYADLKAVVDAVKPALNKNGIAFFHLAETLDGRDYMQTILHHGESDTGIKCDIPLIIGKQDMHGYKSATTYAKRIGLESVTGVAPADDDGNDAVAAAPQSVSGEHFVKLRDMVMETDSDESKFLLAFGAQSLELFPAAKYDAAIKALTAKAASNG